MKEAELIEKCVKAYFMLKENGLMLNPETIFYDLIKRLEELK